MAGLSATRISGLILVIGGVLAVAMRLVRPGDLVVDSLPGDASLLERVRVLAENADLTHISSILGALGILMLLFGFVTIWRALGDRMAGDAVTRFGVVLLVVAVIGFVFSHGLNHMIAHIINHGAERGRSAQVLYTLAVDVQAVKAGVLLITGYVYLLAFAMLGLGLSLRFPSGIHKYLALAVSVIAVAALILLIIADHDHDLSNLYNITKYANIPLNLWGAVLGVALFTGHSSLAPPQSE